MCSDKVGPKREIILLETDDDMIYWCARLSLTPPELRQAISQAGAEAQDLEAYLEHHRSKL